ncbi:SRPBCC family protein [Humibacter soli]
MTDTTTQPTGMRVDGRTKAPLGVTTVRRTASGISLSRTFAASPRTVFRALSEPEHLMRWWGPPNCRVVECSVDFRVGGLWHYRLLSPDGTEHWSRAVYREIVPDERLVYAETGSDADARVVHDRPTSVVTVSLAPTRITPSRLSPVKNAPVAGGTRMDVHLVFVSPLERDRAVANGVEKGFSAALEQLGPVLTQLDGHPQERPTDSHPDRRESHDVD